MKDFLPGSEKAESDLKFKVNLSELKFRNDPWSGRS